MQAPGFLRTGATIAVACSDTTEQPGIGLAGIVKNDAKRTAF